MGSTPAPSQCLEQHYCNRDRSKNETRIKLSKATAVFPKSPSRPVCHPPLKDCREGECLVLMFWDEDHTPVLLTIHLTQWAAASVPGSACCPSSF